MKKVAEEIEEDYLDQVPEKPKRFFYENLRISKGCLVREDLAQSLRGI